MESANRAEASSDDNPTSSVEKLFEGKRVPPWWEQLTVRAMLVSIVLSVAISFMIMKLNLTTGIVPSFSVAAGLLGFFIVKIRGGQQ